MAEIKWIKLSVNMFDDEKIKLIRTMPEGDSIIIIWVQILCLAGKINDSGLVYMGQNLAYTDEMLATILGHPLNVMRIALQTLEQFGMVEVNEDGTIDVLNWEKHQSTDKMARIREQNRNRKRKYDLREKLRKIGHDPDSEQVPNDLEELEKYVETIKKSNDTVTLPNVTEENKNVTNNQESLNDNVNDSNVTVTSGNATEVRSKKKEVNTTTEKKEKSDGSGGKLPSKNVFGTWEELWMFPNLVQKEILVELSEKYSDELVVAAIKVAGANDVIKGRAINFIEAVLKEWEDNNVETIDQAREYTKNRNKGKSNRNYNKQSRKRETLPDWAKEEQASSQDDEVVEDESIEDRLARIREMREVEQ